jgi:hypothetical protein
VEYDKVDEDDDKDDGLTYQTKSYIAKIVIQCVECKLHQILFFKINH